MGQGLRPHRSCYHTDEENELSPEGAERLGLKDLFVVIELALLSVIAAFATVMALRHCRSTNVRNSTDSGLIPVSTKLAKVP